MVIGSLKVASIPCEAIVGVLAHERIHPQPLVLGFFIELDFAQAARTESLQHSVDYALLATELCEIVQKEHFQLLETLVLSLAEFVLKKYSQVQTVEISCAKPRAIIGTSGPVAQVRLHRTN